MHKDSKWGYIFTLPFIINLLVFFLFPFLFSLYLTFTQWNFVSSPEWEGLGNWINMFQDKAFWQAMRNIAFFTLIFVPLQTVASIFFAHLLNQQIRTKSLFRTVFFIPVVTPWIAVGVVWVWLYNYDFGVINWILSSLQLERIHWLANKRWWVVIGAIAIVQVWKGIGQSMILILAGMQNVSQEMIESAKIDGATGKDVFFRIVIPLATPMIYLVIILATISSFQAFDVFLVMLDSTRVPDYLNIPNLMVYLDAFQNFRAGRASTLAWVLFIIILAITLIQRKLEKKWVHYD